MHKSEQHPLQPFIPDDAQMLMLGSFPPSRQRWSMEFFYPNMQNDMWRIFGLLFHGDRDALVDKANKRFDKDLIISLLTRLRIAVYDTAAEVIRTKGTAADNDLQIVQTTDIAALLRRMPNCHTIVCTGGKAAETCAEAMGTEQPVVGGFVDGTIDMRPVRLWRMPSSSRAYPLKLDKKAEAYAQVLLPLTK